MSTEEVPNMGCHLILDFHGTSVNLNNYEELNSNFSQIIIESGATIENVLYKKFDPYGLSIIYLLSESHFSIHTWPEFGACAIDFYHCGETARSRMILAEEKLCDYLGWENCTGSMIVDRGNYAYALMKQSENISILYKKHKLVNREKNTESDKRIYVTNNDEKLLSIDGVIQTGFHNINSVGSFFEESRDCSISNDLFSDYKLDMKKSNSISPKSSDETLTCSKSKEIFPEQLTSTLIIGAGDLSLATLLLKLQKTEKVYVIEKNCNKSMEKLTFIKENNSDIKQYLDKGKIEIFYENNIESLISYLDKDRFQGVFCLCLDTFNDSKLKLKNIVSKDGFYATQIQNTQDFLEFCKKEDLGKVSFHNFSNNISRFLIGKAQYS